LLAFDRPLRCGPIREGARIEGVRPIEPGFRRIVAKLTDWTVPDVAIIGGPGYRMSHGEVTKRAMEASVFRQPLLPQGRMGPGVLRSDPARRDVSGWKARRRAWWRRTPRRPSSRIARG